MSGIMNYCEHRPITGEAQPYLKPFAITGGESVESDVAQVDHLLLESTPRQLAVRSPAIPPPEVLQSALGQSNLWDRASPLAAGRPQLAYLIVDLQDPTGTGQKDITGKKHGFNIEVIIFVLCNQ